MSASAYDVVIVGAGIVGCACAMECAERNLRVALIEKDIVGGGATAAGMGHIVVMDDSEAQFSLTRYSQKLWREMRPELPERAEYEECGTIWVAADEEEMAAVRNKYSYYRDRHVPVELLTQAELERLEPNLRPGLRGGLLVPEDGVLYAPLAARFFLERAERRGAKLHMGRPVVRIGGGRVALSDGTEFSSSAIVNAAGALAPGLTPGIDVKKRKGHLVITDRYPGFVRHQLVELGYLKSAHAVAADSVAFNVQPRKTGQVLVGSSRQYGAEHAEVDRAILSRMLERARQYMPRLGQRSAIRVWTGFRAATADKLPLIGPSTEDAAVYLATGHEGLGITTSLASARLLADQLVKTASAIPIAPYLPSRPGRLEPVHA